MKWTLCRSTAAACLSALVFVATGCNNSSSGGGAAPPPPNSDPVAAAVTVETDEDMALLIDLKPFVTDANGDTITIDAIVQVPTNGTLNPLLDGIVTYTPTADFNGSDTIRYQASDGRGGTVEGVVGVTVRPINDAPLAANDSATTLRDQATEVMVLDNDTDIDLDVLSVQITTNPTNGTAQVTNGGTRITYTPAPGFCGVDMIGYDADDGNGGTDTAILTVEVQCVEVDFQGTDVADTFDPQNPGMVTVPVTLSLLEAATSNGLPNAIQGLTLDIDHDSQILSVDVANVVPEAALQGLNGGAGPVLFDVQIDSTGVVVTIETGADTLDASALLDLLTITYGVSNNALLANPFPVNTQLTWGTGNSFEIPQGTVEPTTQDIDVTLTPTQLPADGFFLFAPSMTVAYDTVTGMATFEESVYLEEGPGGANFPQDVVGVSLGMTHDATFLNATNAVLGTALDTANGGSPPDFAAVNTYSEGVTCAVIISFQFLQSLQAVGPQEVIRVTYETTGMLTGNGTGATTSAFEFVDTIGSPPVENVVAVGPQGVVPVTRGGVVELIPN